MFTDHGKYHYWKYLIAILIISVCSLFIAALVPPKMTTLLSQCLEPGESLFNGTGKALSDCWQTLGSLATIRKELERQKEENKLLRMQLEEVKACREENISLKNLLELKKETGGDSIASQVIGRDCTNWFERLIIDRGWLMGIQKNMVALTPEGLAGQVTETSSSTATVRSILNPRSAVPVYVVESGSYGILCGDGTSLCSLKYIRNISFLKEGQLVVTSGLGNVFPAGLVVGKITKVQGSVDCASNFARVKPFVNFEILRYVLLIRGKS
jgi:rod shape-determining protein MreC